MDLWLGTSGKNYEVMENIKTGIKEAGGGHPAMTLISAISVVTLALIKLIDAILFAVGQWEEAERMDNGIDFCNFVAISSVLQTQSI